MSEGLRVIQTGLHGSPCGLVLWWFAEMSAYSIVDSKLKFYYEEATLLTSFFDLSLSLFFVGVWYSQEKAWSDFPDVNFKLAPRIELTLKLALTLILTPPFCFPALSKLVRRNSRLLAYESYCRKKTHQSFPPNLGRVAVDDTRLFVINTLQRWGNGLLRPLPRRSRKKGRHSPHLCARLLGHNSPT